MGSEKIRQVSSFRDRKRERRKRKKRKWRRRRMAHPRVALISHR